MNKLKQLKQFLLEANLSGYAQGEEKAWEKEKDSSTTIKFKKGFFKSHDNFFGGEPYGGRQVVFYQEKPCWIMVYYGLVKKGIDVNKVYQVLRQALKNMPSQYPFRGPKILKKNNFTYKNVWQGDVKQFSGEEKIFADKKLIFKTNYLGGLVDERRGV